MTNDELKAWLLLAGFKYEFSSYFYLRSGFNKTIIVAAKVDEAILVRSSAGFRAFMDRAEAQQYIQSLIGE